MSAARGRMGPLVLVVAAGLLLAALPLRADAAPQVSPESFIRAVNDDRVARGLRPLRVARDLTLNAIAQSRAMAREGRVYHTRRLRHPLRRYRPVAENVGVGPVRANLHARFMRSRTHRAMILRPAHVEIGVAVVRKKGLIYVTQLFAEAPSRSRTSRPAGGRPRSARPKVVRLRDAGRTVDMLARLSALDDDLR